MPREDDINLPFGNAFGFSETFVQLTTSSNGRMCPQAEIKLAQRQLFQFS